VSVGQRHVGPAELGELYRRHQHSVQAVARELDLMPKTVRRYLLTYGLAERRTPFKYPRQSFSGDPLERAYLQGFRDGDLHVHKANYHETSQTIMVACASTVAEQIELIKSLFSPYGGVHVSATPRQMVITCYLDVSFRFLLEKSDRPPDWALSDRQCFGAYLAGYIDAEGCIQVKRHTHAAEVTIRSCDLNILRACRSRLLKLGVECPPLTLVRPAGEWDGDSGPIHHADYWCLGVYRRSAVNRLFRLISPYMRHAKRRRDMQAAWQNVKERLALRPEDAISA
jgi:LAGLIDADG-like domain